MKGSMFSSFLFSLWEECEQLCFPLATTTTTNICKNKNHCNLIGKATLLRYVLSLVYYSAAKLNPE